MTRTYRTKSSKRRRRGGRKTVKRRRRGGRKTVKRRRRGGIKKKKPKLAPKLIKSHLSYTPYKTKTTITSNCDCVNFCAGNCPCPTGGRDCICKNRYGPKCPNPDTTATTTTLTPEARSEKCQDACDNSAWCDISTSKCRSKYGCQYPC